MARSRNARKGTRSAHAGWEMWSARPTKFPMADKGNAAAKRDTVRAERRQSKAECAEAE